MIKKIAFSGLLSQLLALLPFIAILFFTPQIDLKEAGIAFPVAPLGQWLYGLVAPHPVLARYLTAGMLTLAAFMLNALLIRHDISPRQSVFPAFIALLLFTFSAGESQLFMTLSSMLLLMFSLHNIMNLYGETAPYKMVLNASVSISISAMILPQTLIFMLVIWMGFFTFRINSWREWAISLMGLIFPWFYLALMYVWNDNLMYALNLYGKAISGFNIRFATPPGMQFVAFLLLLFWGFMAIVRFLSESHERQISARKKMWVAGHFTLAAAISIFLSGALFVSVLPILLVALAISISYSVSTARRPWIHDLMALGFVVLVLIIRFGY